MTPRKAVIIGCLISAGFGAVLLGHYGSMIYHWYWTGNLWTASRSGINGHFATYAKSPVEVAFFLGLYGIFTSLGCLAISGAFFIVLYHWKRLFGRDHSRPEVSR
jgi:hypothetical protein